MSQPSTSQNNERSVAGILHLLLSLRHYLYNRLFYVPSFFLFCSSHHNHTSTRHPSEQTIKNPLLEAISIFLDSTTPGQSSNFSSTSTKVPNLKTSLSTSNIVQEPKQNPTMFPTGKVMSGLEVRGPRAHYVVCCRCSHTTNILRHIRCGWCGHDPCIQCEFSRVDSRRIVDGWRADEPVFLFEHRMQACETRIGKQVGGKAVWFDLSVCILEWRLGYSKIEYMLFTHDISWVVGRLRNE